MKQKLMNAGVLIIFYLTIVIGVLLLNQKFKYLNNLEIETNQTYIAMNE